MFHSFPEWKWQRYTGISYFQTHPDVGGKGTEARQFWHDIGAKCLPFCQFTALDQNHEGCDAQMKRPAWISCTWNIGNCGSMALDIRPMPGFVQLVGYLSHDIPIYRLSHHEISINPIHIPQNQSFDFRWCYPTLVGRPQAIIAARNQRGMMQGRAHVEIPERSGQTPCHANLTNLKWYLMLNMYIR